LLRWWRRLSLPDRLTLVGLLVALVAIIPAFLALGSGPRSTDALIEAGRALATSQRALSARANITAKEVQQLKAVIATLQKPPSQGKLASQVSSMESKVRQIDGDVSALQNAILRDPAKALEVPLLRRDIESNQLANQAALVAIQQDIDRQYDLMKWILGTLALGLIGLIFTGLSSRKEAKAGD
jgi:hypothetical protein